jgi:hypothetical protein
MIEFDPPMSIVSMSDVLPGSIVRRAGRFGFCAVSADDHEAGRKLFITYDSGASTFRQYIDDGSELLNFGAKLIIDPDQNSFEFLQPDADATNHLFLVDGVAHIGLRFGNLFEMLDLNSGKLSQVNERLTLSRFSKWSVGVRRSSGDYLPLIQISGPIGEWAVGTLER